MGLLTMPVPVPMPVPMSMAEDVFSTFDQRGGRIGSGTRGSGQGGLAGRRR